VTIWFIFYRQKIVILMECLNAGEAATLLLAIQDLFWALLERRPRRGGEALTRLQRFFLTTLVRQGPVCLWLSWSA
jgi:hypothetical protein